MRLGKGKSCISRLSDGTERVILCSDCLSFNAILDILLSEYGEIVVTLYVDNIKNMLNKIAISLGIFLTAIGLCSCNSDSTADYGEVKLSTDVSVTAFSLSSNDKVLNNLDSVYFSIDLVNARIFNADSLPKGTDVSKLVVNITTNSASKAELTYRTVSDKDSVVNYLEHATDSINFAKGPVRLHIVAADGTTSRDYQIQVNVHEMEPDSMVWEINRRRDLPTSLAATKAKTVKFNDIYYCLTADNNGNYDLATAAHPAGTWAIRHLSLEFVPDVESLTVTDDAFFMLDSRGNLYTSADAGQWDSTGEIWHSIVGGYQSQLLGIKDNSGAYYHVTYPVTTEVAVSDRFPVNGNSQLYIYGTKWATHPQAITVGGRNSAGEPLAETWAYDGSQWANISQQRPVAADGMTLYSYYECGTDTVTWQPTKREVLVLFGGEKSDGTLSRTVYISGDLGFRWKKAGDLMQLPAALPSVRHAQAFVSDVEFSVSRSSSEWQRIPSLKIPFWYRTSSDIATVASRAVAPIDTWQTPFVYLIGGYDENSALVRSIWAGAINKLIFQPLQ